MLDLSIIIPVYNGKDYIGKLVDSLCALNCKKEIIIVDDGSPDGSYEYCCKKFATNPTVKVFSKENGGISSARNFGLGKATARYLMFADQDDMVDGEVISKAYELCRDNDLDGAFWSCDYDKAGVTSHCDIVNKNQIINRQEIHNQLIRALVFRTGCDLMTFVGHIWAGIYKKEIIEAGIKLKHFVDYEDDQLFVLDFLTRADSVGLVSDVGYYWSVNPESYSRKYRQLPDIINRYETYFRYLCKQTQGIFDKKTYKQFKVFGFQFTLCDAVRNSGISDTYKTECVREIKDALKKDCYKKCLWAAHPYITDKRYIMYLFLLKLGLVDLCVFGTSIFFRTRNEGDYKNV